MSHITADDYRAVVRGEMSLRELHQKSLDHLREVCPGCRDDPGGPNAHAAKVEAKHARWVEEDLDWLESTGALEEIGLERSVLFELLLDEVRVAQRQAEAQFEELMALPPEERRAWVAKAYAPDKILGVEEGDDSSDGETS